jgi:hypothetical protein
MNIGIAVGSGPGVYPALIVATSDGGKTWQDIEVSMVFEVINDRGVRLRPYEILKGKLLGQINKIELDKGDYNGLWENKAAEINAFREDELDNFFRFLFEGTICCYPQGGTTV